MVYVLTVAEWRVPHLLVHGPVSSRWSSERISTVEWMMISLRLLLILCKYVLGEGMLDRSMTLP